MSVEHGAAWTGCWVDSSRQNDDVFCVAQMLGINEVFGVPGANTFPSVLCNKQDAESYAFFGDLTGM